MSGGLWPCLPSDRGSQPPSEPALMKPDEPLADWIPCSPCFCPWYQWFSKLDRWTSSISIIVNLLEIHILRPHPRPKNQTPRREGRLLIMATHRSFLGLEHLPWSI